MATTSKRDDLRGLLLDFVVRFFSAPHPVDPYIRMRFTDSKQQYFYGHLWWDRASYEAGNDPMISLKGYPDHHPHGLAPHH